MPSAGTRLTHAIRLTEDQYTVSDKHIPVDGGEILVRFLTPARKTPSTAHPVLVWLHGGGRSAQSVVQIYLSNHRDVGWMFGDVDMDDGCLRTICVELQLTIANVEYRYAAGPSSFSLLGPYLRRPCIG